VQAVSNLPTTYLQITEELRKIKEKPASTRQELIQVARHLGAVLERDFETILQLQRDFNRLNGSGDGGQMSVEERVKK